MHLYLVYAAVLRFTHQLFLDDREDAFGSEAKLDVGRKSRGVEGLLFAAESIKDGSIEPRRADFQRKSRIAQLFMLQKVQDELCSFNL